MQKLILFIIGLLIIKTTKSQPFQLIKTGFGTQGLTIAYERQAHNRTQVIIKSGLDMEGETKKMNDPFVTLGIGYNLIEKQKFQLQISLLSGFQQINHELYKTPIWLNTCTLNYNHFFGKNHKHGAGITLGYMYGKGRYKQMHTDEYFTTEFSGVHKISPVNASIQYCFRF